MKYLIVSLFILSFVGGILYIRKKIKQQKTTPESRISVYKHPSMFKKPSIEMTNKSIQKKEIHKAFVLKTKNNS